MPLEPITSADLTRFRVVAEKPTWGAPRIHGGLMKLGFDLSERTVLRWMRRAPKNPELAQRWKAFLQNHRARPDVPPICAVAHRADSEKSARFVNRDPVYV